MLLLGGGMRGRGAAATAPGLSEYVVLRVVAKLMMPLILLFALYVQLHGEYSPGGGFQAGVIFAAAIVLYALIFGLAAAQQVIPVRVAHTMAALGGLIYLSVGVWALAAGGQFLEYKVLFDDPQLGETVGIVVIELGVGTTVAGVAMSLFYSFAGRASQQRSHIEKKVGADL
jgi:multicomponent Na+:H+ antiporter subunit B